MHVKFANGAGIELITAGASTDDLTRHYLALLAQGEGPAFVGFYTPNLTALEERLDESGIPYTLDDNTLLFSDPALAWPFMFDVLTVAPNEKPEYFQHPNTAHTTLGIWIAGGDQAASGSSSGSRADRSTYPEEKSVSGSEATPDPQLGRW